MGAHQSGDTLPRYPVFTIAQFGVNARRTVRTVTPLVNGPDLLEQYGIRLSAR
jgi:hypothetical protein